MKASVSLKAENLGQLIDTLTRIYEVNIQCVSKAALSVSLIVETDDLSDFVTALGDVTGAVEQSEGVECKVSAPGSAWHNRRLDLTPMERMINSATEPSDLFPGQAKTTGEKALNWLEAREQD